MSKQELLDEYDWAGAYEREKEAEKAEKFAEEERQAQGSWST